MRLAFVWIDAMDWGLGESYHGRAEQLQLNGLSASQVAAVSLSEPGFSLTCERSLAAVQFLGIPPASQDPRV